MDAIEKAVTKYRVAVAEHQAAEVKLTEAKAELVAVLGLGASAHSSTSSEVSRVAAPPVKPPAKPAPKPKATAAPAPKAAPKAVPAVKTDPDAPRPRGVWTEEAARKLWPALTPEWQGRLRRLLAGPLAVAKLFPGESHVGPLFAGLTHKSRAATGINSSPVITEDGTARLADGLDVALRAAGIVP